MIYDEVNEIYNKLSKYISQTTYKIKKTTADINDTIDYINELKQKNKNKDTSTIEKTLTDYRLNAIQYDKDIAKLMKHQNECGRIIDQIHTMRTSKLNTEKIMKAQIIRPLNATPISQVSYTELLRMPTPPTGRRGNKTIRHVAVPYGGKRKRLTKKRKYPRLTRRISKYR